MTSESDRHRLEQSNAIPGFDLLRLTQQSMSTEAHDTLKASPSL